jgi:hypothetical protein
VIDVVDISGIADAGIIDVVYVVDAILMHQHIIDITN